MICRDYGRFRHFWEVNNMGKNNTPQIRFKGFTDAWEQRKLGELAIFNPKADIPKVFEYVDLEAVVGTEMISHRTEAKHTAPSRAQRLAQYGDLFYQTVRPYQKNNYLFEKPDKHYVFSTGYAQMRPFVDGYFLLSLIQHRQFVDTVLDNCTGTSYPAISANDLAEIKVCSPKNEYEHQQIGAFFRNLDNLITLHQRKLEKLKNIKKSSLEKIFPQNDTSIPEVRFANFTDAWEQRKLEDVVEVYDGIHQTPDYKDSGIMFLSVENIGTLKSEKFISEEAFKKEYKVYPQKGDILMTRIGDVGTPNVVETAEKLAFYVSLALLKPSNIDSHFLCNSILSPLFKKGLKDRTLVTAIPQKINKDEIGKVDIVLPNSTVEQQKIGTFFHNLDNLITLHQRKVEKLQYIKKSCLEKMFI